MFAGPHLQAAASASGWLTALPLAWTPTARAPGALMAPAIASHCILPLPSPLLCLLRVFSLSSYKTSLTQNTLRMCRPVPICQENSGVWTACFESTPGPSQGGLRAQIHPSTSSSTPKAGTGPHVGGAHVARWGETEPPKSSP